KTSGWIARTLIFIALNPTLPGPSTYAVRAIESLPEYYLNEVRADDATSQQIKREPARQMDQWPMECEGASSRLDFAVIDTKKLEGTYLIVVARLGDGEFSKRLNESRLAAIKEYSKKRPGVEIRPGRRTASEG